MDTNARMEVLLQLYERRCFIWQAEKEYAQGAGKKRLFYLSPNIANWRELRNTLLHIRPDMTEVDLICHMSKHMLVDNPPPGAKIVQIAAIMDWIVRALAYWTWSSRRVFSISEDLQLLLNATSLRGITWPDIHLPFQSFMVSLAKPLIWTDKNPRLSREFKHIFVVQQNADTPICSFWGISAQDNFRPLFPFQRREITEQISRKRWDRVGPALQKLAEDPQGDWDGGFTFFINAGVSPQTITDAVQSLGERTDGKQCAEILRIVVGMCLYLRSLPPGSPHVSPWQPMGNIANSSQDGGISNPAQICAVSTKFKLSQHERDTFHKHTRVTMGTGGEKCCHFRDGYWSRPRGLGNDPTAEKTQWANPTIVNLHKLKPGEVPKGAEAILLSGQEPNRKSKPE